MFIKPIFPKAVIYGIKLNLDNSEIIEYLKKLTFEEVEEHTLTSVSSNYKILDNLKFLENEIYKNVKYYLNDLFKLKMDFQFKNSWATKTMINGSSEKHIHSNTFLTGVYYPKGNNSFIINFYKEAEFWDIEKFEVNEFNCSVMTFSIEEDNTLFLFPSNLYHAIGNNNSGETRYSIAFNINPKGFIGEKDNKIFF